MAKVAGFIARLKFSETEATRETPPAPFVGWIETTRGPRPVSVTSNPVAAIPLVTVRLMSPSSEVARLRSWIEEGPAGERRRNSPLGRENVSQGVPADRTDNPSAGWLVTFRATPDRSTWEFWTPTRTN